jgi:tetratricopeptide (TPR) repeat protein
VIAVDAALEAVERGDWVRALELVSGPEADRSSEALELRARAAYGAGELEAAIGAWESIHGLKVAAGDAPGAAWAAGMVAMYLLIDTGLMAPVRGWVARGERLLAGGEQEPAAALLAMVRTYERFMCGDADASRDWAERSIRRGRELDVLPAVVLGQVATARLRIADGDVEEGLAQLDEVAALLMSNEVDPLTTGMMYCELICAAQWLGLHDRAREWTEVMDRWARGAAFGGLGGRCRVHRAELLRVAGTCEEAEREALGACDELRPWMRREFGWPLVELGTIRLRKGDLAGAEEAFTEAHQHAWSPQPGLALLRLAQGEPAAAAALIADAIAHPLDIPSKELPPFTELRLAPLLAAQAEIAARRGDPTTAERAAVSLEEIAGRYPSAGLDAAALLARARAALTAGDAVAAIDRAAGAVSAWADLGAPYEAACARLELGRAYLETGNPDRGRMEWSAAAAAFRDFGAEGRAAESEALLAGERTGGTPPGGALEPQVATFLRKGGTRTLGFRGVQVVLPDLKGFRYLERLVAEPGREFHVLDLVAVENGTLRATGASVPAGDTGVPVLDEEARAAYRRRLAEIEEDVEEATLMNDLGRLEMAERDRDYLVAELSRAVGLGGRRRTVGGSSERARTSVARSLRYALQRMAEEHEELAGHLRQSVRTGTYCSYAPDPIAPLRWTLDG